MVDQVVGNAFGCCGRGLLGSSPATVAVPVEYGHPEQACTGCLAGRGILMAIVRSVGWREAAPYWSETRWSKTGTGFDYETSVQTAVPSPEKMNWQREISECFATKQGRVSTVETVAVNVGEHSFRAETTGPMHGFVPWPGRQKSSKEHVAVVASRTSSTSRIHHFETTAAYTEVGCT